MTRFLTVFLLLLVGLFVVVEIRFIQQLLVSPWTQWLAQVCVVLVTHFDTQAAAQGHVLWNPATGFGVSIEPGCNGVEAYLVLASAIIAFPATWLARIWGLGLGFLAVQGLNVLRVISLFYLGQWDKQIFDFAHTYLWQGLIMLDVLVFWLYWVKVSVPSKVEQGPRLLQAHP